MIPTLKHLAAIERRHGLVRSAGREFVFDHDQVREHLLNEMSAPLFEEVSEQLLEEAGFRVYRERLASLGPRVGS